MTGRFSQLHLLRQFVFPALLFVCTITPALAQQGQYHLSSVPYTRPGMAAPSGLATYFPIMDVYSSMIQLRGEDGQVYSFNLKADTIFCQGGMKAFDWSYLKGVKRKTTITVLVLDEDQTKAYIVWDQPPTITVTDGRVEFALPPMCK